MFDDIDFLEKTILKKVYEYYFYEKPDKKYSIVD